MTDRPAPGAHLFFLDDDAVLFSEPRQELHVLNTMTTVIWCHLEDGKDRLAITAELVERLGVRPADAARYVDQALEIWRIQGLLTDGRGPVHAPPPPNRQAPDDIPEFGDHTFVTERHYRLLDLRFRLRCTLASDDALLAPMLAHLGTTEHPVTDFDVVRLDDMIALYRDGRPLDRCRVTEELVPLVHGLIGLEAADAHSFFLDLHAAVVGGGPLGVDGGCILMPAPPGSGKTTLTAAPVRAGWDYWSDEFALLDEASMRVAPLPIALCLKRSGLASVVEFWPEARHLPFHSRFDGKQVAYLAPPSERVAPPGSRQPVHAIVFPRYRRDVDLTWRSLSKVDALRRIIVECVAMSGRLDIARVRALVNWINCVDRYELVYGSTTAAVCAIQQAYAGPTVRWATAGSRSATEPTTTERNDP